MKIVSAAEMREIDRVTSERFGVPSLTLMENAGSAVADFVLEKYPSAKTIGVVCGKGNNGGDGFVAARKLVSAGKNVQVLLLADPSELRGDAVEMFSRLPIPPVIVRSGDDLKKRESQSVFKSDILIDAILGTGFHPPVSELYAEAIAAINASAASVVAVDIPSGADADAAVKQTGTVARADAIVTFTAPRPAHIFGDLTSGPIVFSPIGSPDEAIVSSLNLNVITARDIAPIVEPRPADSNKGNFGHVLVIGGSLGKSGAAAMAAFSALRVGAGLSTAAIPVSVLATVAGFHPELMTEPLEETKAGSISQNALQHIEELAKSKTVLAIGPGVTRNSETAECVRALVGTAKIPIVLDADGLNAFEGQARELNDAGRELVITPHPGEMARLAGCSIADVQRDRLKIARAFAADHNLIVVLKGNRTLVAKAGGEVWVNTTGNPGMATGGTGDILTGMVAGMIAQHPSNIFEAVIAAVHLHGLAGDVAKETMGEHSLVATDLIKALPEAFRRVQAAADAKVVKIGE
jgi:NAD(P)H-hydrate epimerase